MGAKYGVQKIGSGLFYVIQKEKRQPSLAFSLLNCKLQAEKIVQTLKKKFGWFTLLS
jgi:hypothetical protein